MKRQHVIKTRLQRALSAALVALALCAVSQGAFAGTLTLKDWAVTSGATEAFTLSNPNESVYAGGFSGVYQSGASSTSFIAYCVDLAQTFSWNVPFSVTPVNASSVFSSSQYSAIERLYTQHFSATTDKTTTAAFQLALWEIVSESSGTYALSGPTKGSFTAKAYPFGGAVQVAENSAVALADQWLGALGSGGTGGYSLTVLKSATNQDQLMAMPVPEAKSYMMLLAGLGLMGFVARRRQREMLIPS